MMRCLAGSLSLALFFCLTTGCTKQCFLSKDDFDNAHLGLYPRHLESDPTVGITPVTGTVEAPPDIRNADRVPWEISLEETIAYALENGTVSDRTGQGGSGVVNDQLFTFSGGSLNAQSDRIRVLAMNPALAAAGIEQSLARFDAQWITGMNWQNTDELQQGLSSFSNGTNSVFNSSIVKGLPQGGVVNTSFQVEHRNLARPPSGVATGVINPLYTSRLTFGYEQPLWRDYGTEINQLLARFPGINGSTMPGAAAAAFNNKLLPLNQGSQLSGSSFFTDGILIARIRFDSQRAEFERNVNNLVLNVEVAYWKLYQAYGQLYSFEEVMRIAHKVWMNYEAKYRTGAKGLADFAPIRAQYEEFRGERLKALGAVLEAERNLRGIMGLPIEDGRQLIPITAPTLAPFQPNWDAAVKDALALRPELVIARENLRLSQLNLITQKNFLKPDLRFAAQYSPVGFGTRLDGSDTFTDSTGTPRTTNALRSLATDHFNDWTLGLTLNVPLGYRLEHAAVRAAKLNLAQSYEVLKDQEERSKRILAQQYQKVSEWYGRIETSSAERKSYGQGVSARYQELVAGRTTVADYLLDVQRRLALAMAKEFEAIAEYNNSLARYEWSKGTLLPFNNISISEGALPECVQVRAVENERRRSVALLLRERPAPMTHPARLVGDTNGQPHTIQPGAAPTEILSNPSDNAPVPQAEETAPANPGVEKKTSPPLNPKGLPMDSFQNLPGKSLPPTSQGTTSSPTSAFQPSRLPPTPTRAFSIPPTPPIRDYQGGPATVPQNNTPGESSLINPRNSDLVPPPGGPSPLPDLFSPGSSNN
jgi:outer membrane protein TolC